MTDMSSKNSRAARRREQRKSRRIDHVNGSYSIEMDAPMREALRALRAEFIQKFGREPGPEDPVFFDPEADTPQPMSDEIMEKRMVQALHAEGASPASIHAFRKTGRWVTEDNQHLLTAEDLKEWSEAIREYEVLH